MTLHHGDCLEVMAGMKPESVDAIVTDPPYGLGFMGKAWDKPGAFVERKARLAADGFDGVGGNHHPVSQADVARTRLSEGVKSQAWHEQWARGALRVAKPSSYLLAFGGTRTVHRMTVAIEDAGWIIRDMLVWAYASGFPKSKASLKPAWEPIVMARKPGPLRMLAIDECRIPFVGDESVDDREGEATADTRYGDKVRATPGRRIRVGGGAAGSSGFAQGYERGDGFTENTVGRWPANIVTLDDSLGDFSRFVMIPKADRADREPVLGGLPSRVVNITEGHGLGPVNTSKGGDGIRENRPRSNVHPTVKPVDLMRHLVRLVTPTGGVVLDPFLGSGTTALAAEMEGFEWIGIEKEAEYVEIAEARLNGTQRGLGLGA